MSRDSIKIVIPNANVLDRLIGGDTRFELELRQAAAAEFAKRHLKKLAVHPVMERAIIALKKHLKEEHGLIENFNWMTSYYELSDEIKDLIDQRVKEKIDSVISRNLRAIAVKELEEKAFIEIKKVFNEKLEIELRKADEIGFFKSPSMQKLFETIVVDHVDRIVHETTSKIVQKAAFLVKEAAISLKM